jgi:hypothetical protein
MTDIQPIEIDGKHYVDVSIDGQELQRRGPFQNAEAAEATAARFAAFCRGLLRRFPPPSRSKVRPLEKFRRTLRARPMAQSSWFRCRAMYPARPPRRGNRPKTCFLPRRQ